MPKSFSNVVRYDSNSNIKKELDSIKVSPFKEGKPLLSDRGKSCPPRTPSTLLNIQNDLKCK